MAVAYANEFLYFIKEEMSRISQTSYVSNNTIVRMVRNNIAASLPGMDAFTGYDSVTAFASKGKIIAHKLVKDS